MVGHLQTDGKHPALALSSRAEVSLWLEEKGLGQYVLLFAPLDGQTLLAQTDASLAAVQMPQMHREMLLRELQRAY
jgi:hypothetical protein